MLKGSVCLVLMPKVHTLKTVILISSSNLKHRWALSSWTLPIILKNFSGNRWMCLLWVGFKGSGIRMLPNPSEKVLSMSNKTDKELLFDIQEALRRIKAYTHEITYNSFLSDTRTQDAVIRNLEIVGEATKNYRLNSEPDIQMFLGKRWQAQGIDSFMTILVWTLKSYGKSLLQSCQTLPYKLRKSALIALPQTRKVRYNLLCCTFF